MQHQLNSAHEKVSLQTLNATHCMCFGIGDVKSLQLHRTLSNNRVEQPSHAGVLWRVKAELRCSQEALPLW
jgi:hypothetical protein